MRDDVSQPLFDLIKLDRRELTERLVCNRAAFAGSGVRHGGRSGAQRSHWLLDRHACEWLDEGRRRRATWTTATAAIKQKTPSAAARPDAQA